MEDNTLEPSSRLPEWSLAARAHSRTMPTPVTAAIATAMATPPAAPMSAITAGDCPSCHKGGATTVKAPSPAHQPNAVHQIHMCAEGMPAGITHVCAVPMLCNNTAPSSVAATTTHAVGQVDHVA